MSALFAAVAIGLINCQYLGGRTPELTTAYHAVALTNGQVFFGRVQGAGDEYLVLREVFYIQTRQNPETKQVVNILVERGGEAHGPDRMLLNRQYVIQMEPVKDDSNIGRLIAEQNNSAN
ncbi:hypothetical protein J5J83_07255 [Azoarcus sp. L1K30]|uniref:hypothetical protein n=1 Tax=Azoarcus sp. L1K30 TaxID=2820277 RepID=UPI001B832291|nr:hypothetical protein [Azoarcus sp. L1K30]MBR0565908.1 hypothetical protein [Azoarcus sp. L1K30]